MDGSGSMATPGHGPRPAGHRRTAGPGAPMHIPHGKRTSVTVPPSLALFAAATVAEIGGAHLILLASEKGSPPPDAARGLAVVGHVVVAIFQPAADFGPASERPSRHRGHRP